MLQNHYAISRRVSSRFNSLPAKFDSIIGDMVCKKVYRMDKEILEKLLHTCAWCLQPILPGSETFGFGAKARPGIDLADKEGQFVSLKLAIPNRIVVALVPTSTSTAKAEGYDLVFITCSESCAEDLKEALDLERDVFDG